MPWFYNIKHMKQVIFFIAFIPAFSIYAQNIMPGGVQGARVWEITEGTQPGQAQWISKIDSNVNAELIIKGKIKTINNNPALFFSGGTNTINNTLDLGKLTTFSLFTVCQANDTILERVIFSLENDTAAEVVLTNRRLAALDVYRYANYNTNMKRYPKIYSYTQNKTTDPDMVTRRLQFGRPPRSQNLPVSAFSGIVPEVILFNRYVSPKERQKVESYLALKYGISLNQEFPVSYLNSNGEIIWDAEMNTAYSENITGIGRDDLSGLYQSVSESTQTPGVMKIGVMGELKNNSFLIWGDDGKPLRFVEESGIRRLQREWKIATFNFGTDSLYCETNELSLSEIDPLHDEEIYWIMIDRSGTGKYPFRQTDYVQCLPFSSPGGFIKFNPVVFDADSSGNDLFTLIAAPTFFTRSIIQSPTCSLPYSGAVQTEIAGGVPPFTLTLKGISNTSFLASAREYERYHTFEDVSQGGYILRVTDANNKVYAERIWVPNTHLWETRISQQYNLVEGENLILDASEGMPAVNYIYSWTTPDGSHINNEKITIDQPGNYLLSVTDENYCNSTLEINVKQVGRSIFKNVELFPNPVNGWFVVRVSLERRADVNFIISDISGIVLKQTLMQNHQYYMYNDVIQQPGIYLITLESAIEKVSLKLIVQ